VSRVQSAGITGRARIWLTFDDIHTRFGKLPIVAEVVGVPGDHSVKAGPTQEGLIEGRASTQEAAAEAAAMAAAIGAAKGVKDKDKKEAAEGSRCGGHRRVPAGIRPRPRIGFAEGREAGSGTGTRAVLG
jgi:hypothetical protein